MSFHPTEFYICLATSKRLILWDWEHTNNVLAVFETHPLCTIRYIRFNSNSLITGISKIPNNLIFLSRDRNFLQYFVPKSYIKLGYLWIFLLTTNYILEYFELNKYGNAEKIQANSNTWNFVMKLICEQTELDDELGERSDEEQEQCTDVSFYSFFTFWKFSENLSVILGNTWKNLNIWQIPKITWKV